MITRRQLNYKKAQFNLLKKTEALAKAQAKYNLAVERIRKVEKTLKPDELYIIQPLPNE